MDKQTAEYLLLIIILSSLIVIYCIYVICDKKSKIKYYKSTISYSTEWEKYSDMLKIQKRVIRKKQLQLLYLNILVFLRGLIVWK